MADVITVTSGTAGNAGNVAADLQTYFAAQMLDVAELNMVLDQFGEKVPLPSNSSKTIHFVRQEKFSVASTPTQLSEGISPDAIGITMNQFEATAEQYGVVVRISDLAELTAKHGVVQKTIQNLGVQAAETYDQLVYNVLESGLTNIYRPNSRSADTALLASDHLSFNDMIELLALMQDNGARPFSEGGYVLVVAPQVHATLLKDPDFKASVQFAKPQAIWRGEAEMLGGFRIVVSNAPGFAATTQATTGFANKVYSSFALGRGAYQITDLQNLRVYMAEPGGQTDTLEQSRKIGWKFAFKSLVTNATWGRRVRTPGLNSTTA